MAVIVVLAVSAVLGGCAAGAVAWFLPNFDPAAPHAPTRAVAVAAARETEAHPGVAS